MKFLKNYQNEWKGKRCDHVYSTLGGSCYQQCIKCFKFIENRENEY